MLADSRVRAVVADRRARGAARRPRDAARRRHLRARQRRCVRGADDFRRGRVLALHFGLDRRAEGRQARPFQPDGDREADGAGRARHRRGRCRAVGGEAVLRLWARQRDVVSDVGRRDRDPVAGTADAGCDVRSDAAARSDDLLRGAVALYRAAVAPAHEPRRWARSGCGSACRRARRCRALW